jgi:hypothetical protein
MASPGLNYSFITVVAMMQAAFREAPYAHKMERILQVE